MEIQHVCIVFLVRQNFDVPQGSKIVLEDHEGTEIVDGDTLELLPKDEKVFLRVSDCPSSSNEHERLVINFLLCQIYNEND